MAAAVIEAQFAPPRVSDIEVFYILSTSWYPTPWMQSMRGKAMVIAPLTRQRAKVVALAQLLELLATRLPAGLLVIVLELLPGVELARLACVHKSFWVALQSLRRQHPGPRYAPPAAEDILAARDFSSLVRAAWFSDLAVVQCLVSVGKEEHGTPLQQARERDGTRTLDAALNHAVGRGSVQAVELLLGAGASVHSSEDGPLRGACEHGHADVLALLIQHGADVNASNGVALRLASEHGQVGVAALLIQHCCRASAAQLRRAWCPHVRRITGV